MSFREIAPHASGRRPRLSPVRLTVSGGTATFTLDADLCRDCRWRRVALLLQVGEGEDAGTLRLVPAPEGFTLHERGETGVRRLKVKAWTGLPALASVVPLDYEIVPAFKQPATLVLKLPAVEPKRKRA